MLRVCEDLCLRAVLNDAPPSSTTTRSATSWAKPISWLTTIIVIPSRARSFITARTSPTISGSSALVGSSKSMSAKPHSQGARDGHPLLLASGEGARTGIGPFPRPTRSSSSRAWATAFSLGSFFTCTGECQMFSRTVMWGKRLKCWKTNPMFALCRARSFAERSTTLPAGVTRCPMRSPPMRISPSSMGSSIFSVRRNVVLPAPEAPTSTTTSRDGPPGDASKDGLLAECLVHLVGLDDRDRCVPGLRFVDHELLPQPFAAVSCCCISSFVMRFGRTPKSLL